MVNLRLKDPRQLPDYIHKFAIPCWEALGSTLNKTMTEALRGYKLAGRTFSIPDGVDVCI